MDAFKKKVLGNEVLQVLGVRPFLFMMLSEFFSQLAFNMQHFVLIFIIFGVTHSNTAVSGMILSFIVPSVLLSVIAGVYVDRWNKKKVLLNGHLMRAALLLPFLIPNLNLAFIYTFTFLIAVITQFFNPAESSIIPSLVPKDLLISANAVFGFSVYTSMLLGYVLSGPVLLLLGRTNTIIFLITMFVISALFVLGIKVVNEKQESSDRNLLAPQNMSVAREAKEIFTFIRKVKKVMHALFMITIAQSVIFMFAVLAPGYVTTILHARLESLSVILVAPAAIGLGIGAFLLGSFGKKIKLKSISAIGFMIVGASFIMLPLVGRVTNYKFVHHLNSTLPHVINFNVLNMIILLAFIVGFGISLVFIPSNATIQLETHEKMRGRMYGLLSSLIGAVSFLPVILAGGLADLFGVAAVIIGIGIIMAALSVYYLFIFKS